MLRWLLRWVRDLTRKDCDEDQGGQKKSIARFVSKIAMRDASMEVCCQPF